MRLFGNDHRSPRIFPRWLFHYTRAEKRGIFLLLLLILLLWVLPDVWKLVKPLPELKLILDHQVIPDSNAEDSDFYQPKPRQSSVISELHAFDPNTAGENELISLGFSRQSVRRILHYREKGGVFRRKEDLLRIWDIDSILVKKLFPYIKEQERSYANHSMGMAGNYMPEKRIKAVPDAIDLNSADSFALQRLPGIGPKLAARIVAYREKLGGFHSLSQLAEVYGLSFETRNYLDVQGRWHTGNGVYRKIAVNRVNALAFRHPYISRKQALTLEAYRKQHGPFRDSSAMHGVLSFSAEELQRLFPYLDFSR